MMIGQLNDVIDYIERNLSNDLQLSDVARYVGESDHHFRKLFLYITGMPLNEYIKKRKLSVANQDLVQGHSVTEVAFKYGYNSVEGFSRAFRSWSGILPSEACRTGAITSFPKLSFYIDVRGGENMEVKIVEMPAFTIAGVEKRVPMQFEGTNDSIMQLAESITDEQRAEMRRVQNIDPKEIINASYDADEKFMKEEGDLTHMIGVLTTETDISDSLDKKHVDACTWAIFPNEGKFPEAMQETMARTHSEWLPSSNYELIEAPTFSFTQMDSEKEGHAYSEIWLPVKKTQ
ncbi:AraC family transcriptional regulator [Salinicoccus bachuensis]|uniref:AraC family transcriptional regulator n=1 Tax=Salinicoccus bachuensis TaxID=3136731 RepID=A0ABZ3CI69_9STAP